MSSHAIVQMKLVDLSHPIQALPNNKSGAVLPLSNKVKLYHKFPTQETLMFAQENAAIARTKKSLNAQNHLKQNLSHSMVLLMLKKKRNSITSRTQLKRHKDQAQKIKFANKPTKTEEVELHHHQAVSQLVLLIPSVERLVIRNEYLHIINN